MWNAIAFLTYKQHGGSGFNYTLSDVLDTDLARVRWLCDWLESQRGREARALKAAARRGKK